MDLLTVHRNEASRSFFDENRSAAPFFDPAMGCWFVANPTHIEALLQSRCVGNVDYVSAYERFEQKGKHQFPNLRFALSHFPFGLDGAEHRESRRRIASLLAARRPVTASAVPALVEAAFSVFGRKSEVELMSEVLSPLVLKIIGTITETDVSDRTQFQNSSVIFDRMLGLRRRLQLERDIGAIRALIRDGAPGLSQEDEGTRLALFLVGQEPLLGTLGESLHRVLSDNQDRMLSEIAFPASPPETGVPFVERRVREAFELAGVAFSPGERIRLFLHAFTCSELPADAGSIFGMGPRACLGKQLSLEAWQAICVELSRHSTRFRIARHGTRVDNYVFACPGKLFITLTP